MLNPTLLPAALCAVRACDAGSFSAAARTLGLTPAAVSKNIASLEARLGVRLFNRTTRSVRPTPEGERFVERARAGIQALEAAEEAIRAPEALQGRVRVSCGAGFGREFVIPALPPLMERHPGLEIELSLSDQQVDLVAQGFDIGIRGGASPPEGMVARTLARVPHLLVASPAYLKAHGTPRHWHELTSHRLIVQRFLSGRQPPWMFREGGRAVTFAPAGSVLLSSPESAIDAAVAGLGIALVASHHATSALASRALREVLSAQLAVPPVTIAMYYPHRSGMAPRVRAVVEHLVAVLPGALGRH